MQHDLNTMNTSKIKLELIWWAFTGIIAFAVLFPILNKMSDYPFLIINIIFVIVFITFTRYIFLLKHTFLGKQQILKAALIFLSIPLTFYLISSLNYFQTILDEEGIETILSSIPYENRGSLAEYIRNEMIFFGVGSIITSILFPFRMIISIWRTHNKGTV